MHGPAKMSRWRRSAELIGRRAECAVLDQLIGAVRAGESRALVVHGEPGVGKTALLDYVGVQALGCRVVRGSGVQSEMELPFAGLHQLCAPLLGELDRLPEPQQNALRTAFGMSAASTPDRFLVGLAVLGLLSVAAEERPVMCLVDDQQWLDLTSAQVLAFVARRLGTEAVGLLVATRVVSDDLSGLPELVVDGLRPADAGALLDTVLMRPVDAQVRDRIVAETHGNPLALLELPRGLTPAELAGGFGLPGAVTLSGSIEGSFAREVDALPAESRCLMLVAAGDPSGDPALVWRAAALLGIGADAAAPAVDAGLVEMGVRVRFRHPLTRSAIYRSASADERRQVHRALAEATDPELDPDRRSWHRAQATSGPDEEVAAELERSADRARARGGLASAAAFLLRAATLTLDPAHRAARALAAAETHIHAGALDAAFDLLAMADAGPLEEEQRAQADMVRAQLAFITNRGSDAPPLLLKAAARLRAIDADLSRTTYLAAMSAAIFAGRLADPAGDVREIARAARAAPPPRGVARAHDLLLDGTVASYNDGYSSGLTVLRTALVEFERGMSAEDELQWLFLATTTTMRLWDDERWDALSARHVQLARDLGSLSELPLALTTRAYLLLFTGDLDGAAALSDEAQAIGDATGATLAPYGALGVAAFRGDAAAVSDLYGAALLDINRRGEGVGVTFAEWANALLCNGQGRYDDALAAALRGTEYARDPGSMIFAAVELVEAAARTDQPGVAAEVFDCFTEMTTASGTDWALGLRARSQALLTEGDAADGLYRNAIDHLGRTRLRAELARVHLLYGEWLRRERRHTSAREQLRTAHTMFETMEMAAFAERAGRELRAAGGAVRKRAEAHRFAALTAQETQIARMARDGLSNPEIASRLFLSAHTVQYHLRKVFAKLGVTSRSQLDRVLPDSRGA